MPKVCTLTKNQIAALRAAVDAAQVALGELNQLAADIASEWQAELDEKSERWQESAAGQEAAERNTDLQAWVEELPDHDGISYPPGAEVA